MSKPKKITYRRDNYNSYSVSFANYKPSSITLEIPSITYHMIHLLRLDIKFSYQSTPLLLMFREVGIL